jgi:hypothetical protein
MHIGAVIRPRPPVHRAPYLLRSEEGTRRDLHRSDAQSRNADSPTWSADPIAAIHKESGEQRQDAVRAASGTASWSQIGEALGVSKQAAHQRFKDLATGLAGEIKAEHRTMRHARRRGDRAGTAAAKARRNKLAVELRREATQLKKMR